MKNRSTLAKSFRAEAAYVLRVYRSLRKSGMILPSYRDSVAQKVAHHKAMAETV